MNRHFTRGHMDGIYAHEKILSISHLGKANYNHNEIPHFSQDS